MAKQPKKHAGGRPTKYRTVYCNEVIECLAEGHSVTAFAGRIGVARSTVFKWAAEIPEFSDALRVGQAKATEHWENILMKVARDGGGNATAAIFGLKNRAGDDWSDRTVREITGPDGGAISIKERLPPLELAKALLGLIAEGKREATAAKKQLDDGQPG